MKRMIPIMNNGNATSVVIFLPFKMYPYFRSEMPPLIMSVAKAIVMVEKINPNAD